MKYNELNLTASKKTNRVGRGIAGGQGKTAGRGTKGQKSRTGFSKRPGFSGGQNPLMQQLPKLPGFRSFKTKAEIVKTGSLEALKAKDIDVSVLAEAGLISSPYARVKLLAGGELKSSKTVKLPNASAGAIDQINKAGGSYLKVEQLKRPAKNSDSIK
jgi:large subunit ribosomal protein L15